ncbi:SMI1/KNR4 family protein [Halodesulfovibrio sp.]|jgi:hypothetical protein|uniref:SMI1/KNR4 family protein n=1 Tax=Halodesulfovibrio sp. TaxID=1912772 RepID=UPI0025F2A23F|nr:SMI1/KNR4 family protein [Halodesulfovibrio sp.]MCT4536027.1 SMI1/KNR4 family protein [Halodesulfovibrio sp.]
MDYGELISLINKEQGDRVEFGDLNSEYVPSKERIDETEKILKIQLPPSYLWFLSQYGGGEIYGDILTGINPQFREEDVDDIAAASFADRKDGLIRNSDLLLLSTSYGESYLFDTTMKDDDGEFAVVRLFGGERKVVAQNFIEFLIRFIRDGEF